jgi:uncharacterized protein YutE (UPF0331/DUF86 family)/predicted nucleotidyltransferase
MIEKLKDYFRGHPAVVMAFVFGSRGKREVSPRADWDIAVYFKSSASFVEWQLECDYPKEKEIYADLVDLLKTDSVDLIVLNRVAASLACSAMRGEPLVIKDRRTYLEFMLRITQEAEDYRHTVQEYAEVYWRSSSLSEEDRDILNKRLIFLDSELQDFDKFRKLTLLEYEKERSRQREVERWIENIMNAAIDICKTVLASSKKPIPDTYRKIIREIGTLSGFPDELGKGLAEWVELRNILAHEYLDIRWRRIEDFIKRSQPYFNRLIEIVKNEVLRIPGKEK